MLVTTLDIAFVIAGLAVVVWALRRRWAPPSAAPAPPAALGELLLTALALVPAAVGPNVLVVALTPGMPGMPILVRWVLIPSIVLLGIVWVAAHARGEDLRIPLIVTGTDFQTGQPVYWREGDLLDAIMASVAMPGLFPPQVVGGVQVVDGGITDNVPIDVAVAEGADTVIFMLCACCERTSRPVYGLLPVLRRALGIAIDRKYHADIERYAGQAHLIAIEPPINLEIDLLDFSRTAELIEEGYASTMAAFKERARQIAGWERGSATRKEEGACGFR